MSNHFHVVLFINSKQSKRWTDAEVIERWHKLFKGTLQSQRFVAGEQQHESALELLGKQVEERGGQGHPLDFLCQASVKIFSQLNGHFL